MKKVGLVLVLLSLTTSGCAGNSGSDQFSPREMAIERKARNSYEHAIAYMGKGHYLLARQQFSEAAAMAMSQELHDDSLAGLARVEKIIAARR
ncbi:MAG: hypothetical protein ABFS09_07820 [Thermodesulfobacteriota bacterium]